MTFWKQGSLELGPFANLDVKSKTTAGFTNSWLHPPNQLRNPQKETWYRFSIKSRNSYSVGIWFRHFPRDHEVSQNLLWLSQPTGSRLWAPFSSPIPLGPSRNRRSKACLFRVLCSVSRALLPSTPSGFRLTLTGQRRSEDGGAGAKGL